MIDWLTIVVALVIITGLVAFFGYFAWKINESDKLTEQISTLVDLPSEKKKSGEQNKKKRKEQKKVAKREEVEEENEKDEIVESLNRKTAKNKSTPVVVVEAPTAKPNAVKVKNATKIVKPPVVVVAVAKKSAAIVEKDEDFDEEQPFTVVGSNRNKNQSTTKPKVEPPVVRQPTPPVVPVAPVPPKIADLVKNFSSSKIAATELITGLDALPFSSEDLDLLAEKINVLNKGKSTRVENDVELRRLNDLLKEKEKQIEVLQNGETNQIQQRVMQEQICKLSVQNGDLEKKIKRLENLVEEKEKENEELKRVEIVHVEPQPDGLTAEDREKLLKEISQWQILTKQIEENLVEILPEKLREEICRDDQWFLSYRKILQENFETTKRQNDENEKLRKNISEVENQLKDIEQLVQTKEDLLILELKKRDEQIGNILNENENLTGEISRLRNEFERVQTAYETSLSDIHALKVQLDERFLVAANTPPIVTDDSFELIKQSPPSSSPIVIDMRAEQLNELIRSSKEALENQDSLTQQLDRQIDDLHRTSENTETSSAQQ